MAWRKYDSGKNLDENCGFLTFEIWFLLLLLQACGWDDSFRSLLISYYKGASQTVWLLRKTLSGCFWDITSSGFVCSARAMQCSCCTWNAAVHGHFTSGMTTWFPLQRHRGWICRCYLKALQRYQILKLDSVINLSLKQMQLHQFHIPSVFFRPHKRQENHI